MVNVGFLMYYLAFAFAHKNETGPNKTWLKTSKSPPTCLDQRMNP